MTKYPQLYYMLYAKNGNVFAVFYKFCYILTEKPKNALFIVSEKGENICYLFSSSQIASAIAIMRP